MGLTPFVTFVQPIGQVGQIVQILGQGLASATSVTFNGVEASSFNILNNTYMTAVVPTGAKTGPVVVTTPAGTLTSNKLFEVVNRAAATRTNAKEISLAPTSRTGRQLK